MSTMTPGMTFNGKIVERDDGLWFQPTQLQPHGVSIAIKRLPHAQDLAIPAYAHPGDAGMDVRAAWSGEGHGTVIRPGEIQAIPTGLCFALPPGWEMQVRSRSGLAKQGLVVTQGVGTIDAGYRGEVMVLLTNLSGQPKGIVHGDRIAQLVLAPVHRAVWREVEELDETVRGEGGFGSSGR